MASLALVVVVGVGFRKAGAALVWYDEIASVLLAWLTYYGAALAALRRAHIGFPTVMSRLPQKVRVPTLLVGELVVVAFFAVVAWAGWQVLQVLGGTTLVSLPWLPRRLTQSVIPVGAGLFVAARMLSLPDALRAPGPGEEEQLAFVEAWAHVPGEPRAGGGGPEGRGSPPPDGESTDDPGRRHGPEGRP